MIERTTGIVLRTRRLTETSLIVHWLTTEFGRIATVAKGAQRPKSPLRGKLDLFYLADFTFVRSRRSDLHTLREVGLRETHSGLREDLAYVEQASYCAALIEQTTETETPLPQIFELMEGLLRELPRHRPQTLTVLAFEIKLLRELGQGPDVPATALSAGAKRILAKLTELDWSAVFRLKLSAPQTRELQQFLHGFLIYHLGKIPSHRSGACAGD
jgi:DNA repair protein RecO (recombination protein O)